MYDIAIIGGGPGGYVAAIKAAQLGASVLLVEKDALGGTCLNKGCIPSKTMLAAADRIKDLKKFSKYGLLVDFKGIDYKRLKQRKDITVKKLSRGVQNILKSYKNIDIIIGEAIVLSNNELKVCQTEYKFKNLILATGSVPADLPGIKPDSDFILNSNDILELNELPKSLLVVGSGAIGIEWARIFSSLGVEVSIVEIADRLLPASDKDVSSFIESEFKDSKIQVYTSLAIEGISSKKVHLTNGNVLQPEKILLATGRRPSLDAFSKLDIKLEKGFVKVDSNFCTNIPNVYAVGDLNGHMQLAHVASHQAILVVEQLLSGKDIDIDYLSIPFVIYGKPEIASVGLCDTNGFNSSVFPISILGKSVTDDESNGFVKVVENNGKIAGAIIVAKEASSLINILALAIKEKIDISRLKEFVFAHPSYSEAIQEAILGLDKLSLNLPKEEY